MSNPTAAMLVIGDEILSGRTRDANMHHLAGVLYDKGISLGEVRIVSDTHALIVEAVRALHQRYDHLFTSGGIGPTHDDITADAVADALNTPIDVRADARALLAAHYAASGSELNQARLRMARIPQGARLIDNPISAAPGFSLQNVHVMAGVPSIFRAMLAGLIPQLTGGAPLHTKALRLLRGEGEFAQALGKLAQEYPALSIGSYPFQQQGCHGAQIVLRGTDLDQIDRAFGELEILFKNDVIP